MRYRLCVCTKKYDSWLAVDKVIAIIIKSLLYFRTGMLAAIGRVQIPGRAADAATR